MVTPTLGPEEPTIGCWVDTPSELRHVWFAPKG